MCFIVSLRFKSHFIEHCGASKTHFVVKLLFHIQSTILYTKTTPPSSNNKVVLTAKFIKATNIMKQS